jgi:hypothetical protein
MSVALGVLAVLMSACTSQGAVKPVPTTPDSSPPRATTPVSIASCQRVLQSGRYHFPEFKGRSDSSVTLYGLLFGLYPLPPRREEKIVWRMTGSGVVRFEATGPQGQRIGPVWGPEPHGDSTFSRPGDEWGTAFRFPAAGCWTVHVTRGASAATASLLVK